MWKWRRRGQDNDAPAPLVLTAVSNDLARGAARLGALAWTDWRRFDAELRARTTTAPDWIAGWWGIAPDAVIPYCSAAAEPTLAAALLSMHPNGRVREAAVRQLILLGTPDCIPALILRSTDWVRQVRDAASEGLDGLRETLGPSAFLPALSLLEQPRWSVRARADSLDETRSWLLSRIETADLVTAVHWSDPKVRRAAARALVARSAAGAAVMSALDQSDPVAATIIANGMTSADWALPGALERALDSRFSQVASSALAWLQTNDPERALEASLSALMSRSTTLRFLAQHVCRMHGSDSRAVYLAAIGSQPVVALAGLGEVGDVRDADLVSTYLNASRPSERAAATTALGRLAGRSAEERLSEMLADSSPRVARSASWALIRMGATPATIERVWEMAVPLRSPGLRKAAFRLFGSGGRWTALRLACRGIGSDDADLDARCRDLLANCMRSWNQSFTSPPAGERLELDALVPRAVSHLSEADGETVMLSVKPYLDR